MFQPILEKIGFL